MDLLHSLKQSVRSGLATLEEKNRKRAQISRIRGAMKREEKAAAQQYISLGRYYYHHLRDKDNAITEPHCQELEQIEKRLDNAITQLENLYAQEAAKHAEHAVEITLEDVQCMDDEPQIMETASSFKTQITAPEKDISESKAAELEENDSLPFEEE